MARYPVVLLDVGETLVGPQGSYGAVYRRVLKGLGLDLDQELLERTIRATSAEIASDIPPGVDRFGYFDGGEQEYWRRFVAGVMRGATGREPEPSLVRRALDRLREAFGRVSAWCVYEDVRPALEALRQSNVRLGIVSNWDSRLPRLLELLGLAGYFEVVGVSHLERVEKPDPALFRRVLARLGADPREALHVGNSTELDVAGARAAGIDGLLIDRAGNCGTGEARIRDLRDLPRISERGLRRAAASSWPRSSDRSP